MSLIQEFLKYAAFMGGPAEDSPQKATGGLKGAPTYDATADATALDNAIKAKGWCVL
ncbi:hypothetical protein GDO81_001623 [Engystomops pustulosus]|uniref:Uncharacterized protein n=1 Tax=Engystomops pustulosus TaxID=76066 RepID=A0AAV7DF18_ENGPU|nr:hypothetical protein GDO81_001623 [Engystomops pustulosus]